MSHLGWLTEHCDLLQEELNVKAVEFSDRAEQYITYSLLPDPKRLGPRLGKRLPALKTALAAASADKIRADLEATGTATIDLSDGPIALDREDLQVRLQAKPGWAAAQGPAGVVVLSTELSPDLLAEGLANELIHAISARRKDLDLSYTDRIRIGLVTDSEDLKSAAMQFAEMIKAETLCAELRLDHRLTSKLKKSPWQSIRRGLYRSSDVTAAWCRIFYVWRFPMSLRFRQRVKICPGLYLNLSTAGLSFTAGVPGASVNIGPTVHIKCWRARDRRLV